MKKNITYSATLTYVFRRALALSYLGYWQSIRSSYRHVLWRVSGYDNCIERLTSSINGTAKLRGRFMFA